MAGSKGAKNGHAPSKYRSLVKESKSGSGRTSEQLISEAAKLKEPYFRALALFDLSSDPRLEEKAAVSAAEQALECISSEERLWRRAELLTTLAKKTNTWRDVKAEKFREKFLDVILSSILAIPAGKGLSDAISGCAPRIGNCRLKPLLNRALENKGFEVEDAKAVIKHWAQQYNNEDGVLSQEEILDTLKAVDNGMKRSRLLGYLHLQCQRSDQIEHSLEPLKEAIKTTKILNENDKLDTLRYLAQQLVTEDEFALVLDGLTGLDDPANKANFYATLAGSADKASFKNLAVDWFKDGLQLCTQIVDPNARASIKQKLASGLERCGEDEMAAHAFQEALDDCKNDMKLQERILTSIHPLNLEVLMKNKENARSQTKIAHKTPEADIGGIHTPNSVLALYDTYEGGLKPVHFRAVARAAPLCIAFGLDLAIIGFPTDDLAGLVELASKETNIGKGGKYLKTLFGEDRITLVPCTKQQPPTDWSALGLPVATTSHPEDSKRISINEMFQIAKTDHPLKHVCLIVGLGKSGLPQSLLDKTKHHLELTGRNIPLETCTAIGVAAQQLKDARE